METEPQKCKHPRMVERWHSCPVPNSVELRCPDCPFHISMSGVRDEKILAAARERGALK